MERTEIYRTEMTTELALVELLQKAFKQFGGKGVTDVEILRPRGIERVEISEKETK